MEIENLVLKYALANAVEYGGKANPKAVLRKVLAEKPELRKEIKELIKKIENIIEKVNSWPLDKQKEELEKLGFKKLVKEEKKGLPELPEVRPEKVVMRIAVTPNGPFHIGHARMVILNDEYTKRYKGKLILRFDDTDPKNPNKIPLKEAYKWIENDLKWLNVKYSNVERASARLKVYYRYFEEFLERRIAYICMCDRKEWSTLTRVERKECPCRSNSVEKNLELWNSILSGEFREGEAVGRIKTDINHPDPAVIDWVAFRIVDEPKHPFSSEKVWPTLDFASAIDDYDFGVTHIIRGKDLMISEKRQKILYEHLGWKYPVVRVFGRFKTTEKMILSTSKIREGIKKGIYSGYDDPRLVFLMSFRKRGIQPQAIRNYIINLGLSEVDTTVDLNILYSENRKLIDPIAKRYFFISDPMEIELDRIPFKFTKAPLYPGKEKYREIPVSKKIFIEKHDFTVHREKEIRLMHLCNIKLDVKSKITSLENKDIPKIHWVSQNNVKIKVIMPDGKEITGLAEPEIENVKPDDICQFERFGFVRCDKKGLFYFAHK